MNFKKLFTAAFILCSVLFVQGTALAATVHGTVYEWYSFEPLNNVVIEVNSTPEQYFVAVDSVYSFNLTPGNYLITASYFEGNTAVYTAEETVKITENGDYVVDILLFPTYEEELLDQSEFDDFDQDFEEAELVSEDSSGNAIYGVLLVVLCILLFAAYFWNKRKGKPPEIPNDPPKENKVSGSKFPENAEAGSESSEKSEESAGNSKEEKSEDKSSETDSQFSVTEAVSEVEPGEVRSESGLAVSTSLRRESEEPGVEEPGVDKSVVEESVVEESGAEESGVEEPGVEKSSVEETGSEEPSSEVPSPEIPDVKVLDIEVSGEPEAHLPEDLKEVLELIRASGNRITQLELRKKSRYSESKVSLMLSDLEERGLIEKFKKGRGNIIRISDEHVFKRDNVDKIDKEGESS